MDLIFDVFTVTCTINTQAFAKRLDKRFLISDSLTLRKALQHFTVGLADVFDSFK